jgi:hypothetical protein
MTSLEMVRWEDAGELKGCSNANGVFRGPSECEGSGERCPVIDADGGAVNISQ